MKKLIPYILLLLPFLSEAQLQITGKVIPWKEINKIDSFEVLVRIDNDTLLLKKYDRNVISKRGQHIADLFTIKSSKGYGQLYCLFRYGKKEDERNWRVERHQAKLKGREHKIEIEFHLQGYTDGSQRLSEFVIKKVYNLPEGLTIRPIWNYKLNSNPKYLINNNSYFILYGQSGDGYFEGELSKMEEGIFKKHYTGGYNYEKKPELPLYRNGEIESTIRDHRNANNKFLIREYGQYKYLVRLGFKHYELSSSYGNTPSYGEKCSEIQYFGGAKNFIKEYFELYDEFEIE